MSFVILTLLTALPICLGSKGGILNSTTTYTKSVNVGCAYTESLSFTLEYEYIYSLEKFCLNYTSENPLASSTEKAVAFCDETKKLKQEKDASGSGAGSGSGSNEKPETLEKGNTACFKDFFIQLLFKLTITKSVTVCTSVEVYNNETNSVPSSPPQSDTSDDYENLRLIIVQWFFGFGVSIESGAGAEIYLKIANACGTKDNAALYESLSEACDCLWGLNDYETTTTVTTAAPTTASWMNPDDITECELFILLVQELFLDINVVYQVENLCAEFLSEERTSEEKALFFIELITSIKTGTCSQCDSITEPPAGFPSTVYWSEFLLDFTLEYTVECNYNIRQACQEAVEKCGIEKDSNEKIVVTGKYVQLLHIYEVYILKLGFTLDFELYYELKNCLTYPKYTDETRETECKKIIIEIICFCNGYCGDATVAPTTSEISSTDFTSESTTDTAAPTTASWMNPDDITECELFILLVQELFLDINVVYQVEYLCAEFSKEEHTSEEKALFFIELVTSIKTGTCSQCDSITEPPAGFPSTVYWSEFLLDFTLEYTVECNYNIRQACQEAIEKCGIEKDSKEKVEVTGKYVQLLHIYEVYILKLGFTLDFELYYELKNCLTYPKYTDETRETECKKIIIEIICFCNGYCGDATVVPTTSEISSTDFTSESTTDTAAPTTASWMNPDDITECELFILLVQELFLDINVVYQVEYLCAEFSKEEHTSEEKALFFIELITSIKTGTCSQCDSITEPPAGFPSTVYWSEFLLDFTLEYTVECNYNIRQACQEAIEKCGIEKDSKEKVEVTGKYVQLLHIYEVYILKLGFTLDFELYYELKNCLTYPKYTDETRETECKKIIIEIICFCNGYCGDSTVVPTTSEISSTDFTFESTTDVTEATTDAPECSCEVVADGFIDLLVTIFGDCSCSSSIDEHYEFCHGDSKEFEEDECYAFTSLNYTLSGTSDSSFDLFIELFVPGFSDFLVTEGLVAKFIAEFKLCKEVAETKECVYFVNYKFTEAAQKAKVDFDCGCPSTTTASE